MEFSGSTKKASMCRDHALGETLWRRKDSDGRSGITHWNTLNRAVYNLRSKRKSTNDGSLQHIPRRLQYRTIGFEKDQTRIDTPTHARNIIAGSKKDLDVKPLAYK